MLQTSRHQGDPFFKGNGRQCMANSVQACIAGYSESPSEWTSHKMDQILNARDRLYNDITAKKDVIYLSVDDIPLSVDGILIRKRNPFHGTIHRLTIEGPFYVYMMPFKLYLVLRIH